MMGGTDMYMGYWSLWHWVVFSVFAVLTLYPIGRILGRIGFSPLWSIVAFVPFANLLGLWIIALAKWPRDREDPQ